MEYEYKIFEWPGKGFSLFRRSIIGVGTWEHCNGANWYKVKKNADKVFADIIEA